jgi:hypothetical protein
VDLDEPFWKNRGVDGLFSTSESFKNLELLNSFSELDPILFLMLSYAPFGLATAIPKTIGDDP